MYISKVAKSSFHKIPKPTTCNLQTYTKIYTQTVAARDKAKKNLIPINLDHPPKEFEAQANFYNHFPPEVLVELRNRVYDASVPDRAKVWKKFDLPIDQLEQKFKKVIVSRIKISKSKGYKRYVDMFLERYGVSDQEFEYFSDNIDGLIAHCNKRLPKNNHLPEWFYSNFNLPCFTCRLDKFPFQNDKEVINFVAKEFKLLSKFKNKIVIETGDYSKTSYQVKNDSFLITLAKRANKRHRTMDLIHELSHVIWYLQTLNKNINPYSYRNYLREKKAIETEISILKDLSPKLYEASLAEVLLTLRRVLFEIELYNNPKQDLSKLYAETFNRCFYGARQKSNPTYLIDDRIVMNPFYGLPHAVANTKVLFFPGNLDKS